MLYSIFRKYAQVATSKHQKETDQNKRQQKEANLLGLQVNTGQLAGATPAVCEPEWPPFD